MVTKLLFVALTTLSLLGTSNAQNITADAYFYGQSPPVYPSRQSELSLLCSPYANLPPQHKVLVLVTGLLPIQRLELWWRN